MDREPHRVCPPAGRPEQPLQLQEHRQASRQLGLRHQDHQEAESFSVPVRLPTGLGTEFGAAFLGLQSEGGNYAFARQLEGQDLELFGALGERGAALADLRVPGAVK